MIDDNEEPVESIDDGWDSYCSRVAGGRLLRTAAALYEGAGSKGSESIRHRLDMTVHKLKVVAFEIKDETALREVMANVLDMGAADIDAAVRVVKEHALVLRGQMALPGFDAGERS